MTLDIWLRRDQIR